MKNQNDMIFSISAIALALIFGAVFYFTAKEPIKAPSVKKVPLTTPAFEPGTVSMGNSLEGGGDNGSAGGPEASSSVGAGFRKGGRR